VTELEKMAGSWKMWQRRPHRLLLLLLSPFHCRGEQHRQLPNLRPSHYRYRRLLLASELHSRVL
jgi:hypothetical protein